MTTHSLSQNAGAPMYPSVQSPQEAVLRMCSQLRVLDAENVPLAKSAERVLAQAIVSDRDNPPCDVSAMDGYALRLADASRPRVSVAGEVAMGQQPQPLPMGQALRIFTGGPVPAEAELILQREEVIEEKDAITTTGKSLAAQRGQHIRKRGENAPAGALIVPQARVITPAIISALASFGYPVVSVRRQNRIAILTTGNELVCPDQQPQAWQWRDSNGPVLQALVQCLPWATLSHQATVRDDPHAVKAALSLALQFADVVLLTGGVSAGDHDYVPDAVRAAGGKIVFHKLPLRPGRPLLGAIGPQGQCIFGLPGNPMSVLACARRVVVPTLHHMVSLAGNMTRQTSADERVSVGNPDEKSLKLWWYRPVILREPGVVELIDHRGSGDIVAMARSDGVIEVPPTAVGAGPFDFYSWTPR